MAAAAAHSRVCLSSRSIIAGLGVVVVVSPFAPLSVVFLLLACHLRFVFRFVSAEAASILVSHDEAAAKLGMEVTTFLLGVVVGEMSSDYPPSPLWHHF